MTSPTNPNKVYVVMVGGKSIHSIHSNAQAAQNVVSSTRGATMHGFPLIAQQVDANTGMTEDIRDGMDDEFSQEFGDPTSPELPMDTPPVDAPPESEDEMNTTDGADVVCMDIPLTIRLLEFAREEATDDTDLHLIAENIAALSSEYDTVLTMEHYDELIEGASVEQGDGGEFGASDSSEFGDDQYQNDSDMMGGMDDDSRFKMNEGMQTFGQFLQTLDPADRVVPSVKEIFKSKRSSPEPKYNRSEIVQDKQTSAMKVADELSTKK